MLSQRYLSCFYGFTESVNLSAVIRTSGTKEKGDRKSILKRLQHQCAWRQAG